MDTNFDLNLVEIARRFPDDASARAYLEAIRWPDGPVCPHCGVINNAHRIPENIEKKVRPGLYLCRDCSKQFTVTIGTVFESSKVNLSRWLIAWHLVCASKKGIAALELERLIGVSYKTAWFMLMRIRESLKSTGDDGGRFRGFVEADASFIGGKKRGVKGVGKYTGKKAVLTVVERSSGRARSMVADQEHPTTVAPLLARAVDASATLVTDGAHAYETIGRAFAGHETVNHSRKEFVRGEIHTGTVDSFHGLLKRGHYGVWHKLSQKYLARYVTEFDYRFSNRGVSDSVRSLRALRTMDGRRLRLVDLKANG